MVCNYATRFPEAFALKSIDAEHVAEALTSLFSRVGVPEEILTDQGTEGSQRKNRRCSDFKSVVLELNIYLRYIKTGL